MKKSLLAIALLTALCTSIHAIGDEAAVVQATTPAEPPADAAQEPAAPVPVAIVQPAHVPNPVIGGVAAPAIPAGEVPEEPQDNG